ncbi:hypothetical protein [Vibrio sp. D401a]
MAAARWESGLINQQHTQRYVTNSLRN